ncbi:MAG: hypothetical protein NTX53_08725 [candidate division WOR-3 bacterium]|nr:hypothetical protein [candidate division WOR-3 bacterium]
MQGSLGHDVFVVSPVPGGKLAVVRLERIERLKRAGQRLFVGCQQLPETVLETRLLGTGDVAFDFSDEIADRARVTDGGLWSAGAQLPLFRKGGSSALHAFQGEQALDQQGLKFGREAARGAELLV